MFVATLWLPQTMRNEENPRRGSLLELSERVGLPAPWLHTSSLRNSETNTSVVKPTQFWVFYYSSYREQHLPILFLFSILVTSNLPVLIYSSVLLYTQFTFFEIFSLFISFLGFYSAFKNHRKLTSSKKPNPNTTGRVHFTPVFLFSLLPCCPIGFVIL